MYLKYLQIVNYKNLEAVKFSFDKGANTIIGENDSGKSNAMKALRILLDDTFYYNEKKLKESDFSDCLGEWRGHWIIISAFFDDISDSEYENEVCRDIVPEKENQDFLKSFIRCKDNNFGTVTLFIRPKKQIRKMLFEAKDENEFKETQKKIKLTDYEFFYSSRTQVDFTKKEVYQSIVGNMEACKYTDPDEEDTEIIGGKLDILEIWKYISVVYVDALRDVEGELKKPRNPIRRIIDTIQSEISEIDINEIKEKIGELNKTISGVDSISQIGVNVNQKLNEMIGMVYSPDIILESKIKDDISSLSKFLTVLPSDKQDIDLLGLGHLNMLFIALKLVEFEMNRNQELMNLMIIEEPEAHIHTHIQKTLFDNLSISKKYTQVLMTTHSVHLAEVADIVRVNILKTIGQKTIVMQPTNKLDAFGKKEIGIKDVSLTKCLERYLDAKRSVLLFSKGVILVEGDGEEILIPHMIKKSLGVSLDELGIGVVNVGNVTFENIACIFSPDRLQRYCAIITDMDRQIENAKKCSKRAEDLAKTRKEKLNRLFAENPYVDMFYSNYTLEVDFANEDGNKVYIEKIIDNHYVEKTTILAHKRNLNGTEAEKYDSVLTVVGAIKKGWYAVLLSEYIDSSVMVPEYIIDAIAFASREVITLPIIVKMARYSLNKYEGNKDVIELKKRLENMLTNEDKINFIKDYRKKFPNDMVSIFMNMVEKYGKNI